VEKDIHTNSQRKKFNVTSVSCWVDAIYNSNTSN